MKNLLLFLSFITLSVSINAQTLAELLQQKKEGHTINGEIVGLQDSTVMLAYYFGGKQYAT
ncbi:MAG: hypothetical protein P8P67_05120, partial [Flavobacteriales bacterium]|nr:hypothetical protein [Flavobacteriales bacterium]